MQRAFAYLRVSGKGQVEGDGFPRQLAAIKSFAASHSLRIVKVFREEGVCGATELEHRPALLSLFQALSSNGVKLVLIERLDRLARDLMVQETIIADLRKRCFDLLSVTEPDLLQNDPTRILMRQIFGAIAQYEKAMIVAKLQAARSRIKAREGRCEGRKPFGTYPGEDAIVARMQALRGEGLSFDSIADRLNGEGLPTRTPGKRWWGMAVSRILRAQAGPQTARR